MERRFISPSLILNPTSQLLRHLVFFVENHVIAPLHNEAEAMDVVTWSAAERARLVQRRCSALTETVNRIPKKLCSPRSLTNQKLIFIKNLFDICKADDDVLKVLQGASMVRMRKNSFLIYSLNQDKFLRAIVETLGRCMLNPESIGYDMNDSEVKKHVCQ